jgi:hypothetical protein
MDCNFNNIKKLTMTIEKNSRQSIKNGLFKRQNKNSNYKNHLHLLNLKSEMRNWEKRVNYMQLFQMKWKKVLEIFHFHIKQGDFYQMQEVLIKNLKELNQMQGGILMASGIMKAIIITYKNIQMLLYWITR